MDSEQSSELFDSESKKLQDTLESIQKKSEKTIPEIIDVYYQAIKVDSLAKVLKENFQTKPEHEAFLARIDKTQKYISEEFNASFHPKILTQLTDSIQKNTENICVVLHKKINLPCKTYLVTNDENSLSRLFIDVKNFVISNKLDKLKIFKINLFTSITFPTPFLSRSWFFDLVAIPTLS